MWRLTLKQEKQIGEFVSEQEVILEDENQNNLLDLMRYLSECKTPKKTGFELREIKEEVQ